MCRARPVWAKSGQNKMRVLLFHVHLHVFVPMHVSTWRELMFDTHDQGCIVDMAKVSCALRGAHFESTIIAAKIHILADNEHEGAKSIDPSLCHGAWFGTLGRNTPAMVLRACQHTGPCTVCRHLGGSGVRRHLGGSGTHHTTDQRPACNV
jgi:hypothetical protein